MTDIKISELTALTSPGAADEPPAIYIGACQ
jgi:hypothetical protein